jgi:hypothetical protein
MTTIDEAMRALCAKHDLTCLSIGVWPNLDYEPVTVYAHWKGSAGCSAGHGKTVAEAMSRAITESIVMRSGDIEVPEIALTECAKGGEA